MRSLVPLALELRLLLFHYRLYYDKRGRVANSTCPIALSRKVFIVDECSTSAK